MLLPDVSWRVARPDRERVAAVSFGQPKRDVATGRCPVLGPECWAGLKVTAWIGDTRSPSRAERRRSTIPAGSSVGILPPLRHYLGRLSIRRAPGGHFHMVRPSGGAEIRPATPPTSHVYPNSALRDESSTNRLEIPATAGKSSEVSGRSRALRDAAILDPMFLPVGQTFRPNLLLTRLPNPLAYSLAFCMKVPRDWMGGVMMYWLANSPNKGC